jgi:hypothetical protein
MDAKGRVIGLGGVFFKVDPKREEYDYGRFAWIMDPEGNRIELWEPPKKRLADRCLGTHEETTNWRLCLGGAC